MPPLLLARCKMIVLEMMEIFQITAKCDLSESKIELLND